MGKAEKAKKGDRESINSLAIQFQNLAIRVNQALESKDADIVHSLAGEYDILLRKALVTPDFPVSLLLQLHGEFTAFATAYRKKPQTLLKYLGNCLQRFDSVVLSQLPIEKGDEKASRVSDTREVGPVSTDAVPKECKMPDLSDLSPLSTSLIVHLLAYGYEGLS